MVIWVVWAVVRVYELVWGVSERADTGHKMRSKIAPAGRPVGPPRGRFPVVFNLVDNVYFLWHDICKIYTEVFIYVSLELPFD